MVSVVIADPHEMVRYGLHKNLSDNCDYSIDSDASDGYTAIKKCRMNSASIIILGESIARPDCMKVIESVKSANQHTHIIIISDSDDTGKAFQLFSAGVIAVVPRNANVADFLNAVRSAELGYACLPEAFIKTFTAMRRNTTRTGNIYGLSPREMEVVHACGTGANTKEVAHRLAISVRTVEAHRNAIYRKTNCKSLDDIVDLGRQISA